MGDSLLVREMRACGGPAAFLAKYGEAEVRAALACWPYVARPEQLEPIGDWDTWFVMAGRGWGKTRVGAETVHGWASSGRYGRMALVAPTAADARDVMVEGESGLIAVSERARFPVDYEPSKRRLTWPNGARATLFSAEEPKRLRGPQHDAAWCDELPWWADVQHWVPGSENSTAWDQLKFGLRLGSRPRTIVTATPRAIALVRALVKDPMVTVTKGSTYDNSANLAASFLRAIRQAYEGTRLGRQELNAEILEDNPNALWKQALIDLLRIAEAPLELLRAAVAIDPAVTSNPDSDLTGIVSGGVANCRVLPTCNGELHGFVLDDASGIYTPAKWAEAAARVYHHRRADRALGEVNNGGDLVESNLRAHGDATISYRAVHASRGKVVRAEPVAALYEQKKVHHVGTHPKLEDEMTQWDPLAGMRSPSRMDALVWLLTDLMLDSMPMSGGKMRHGGTSRYRQ